MYRVVVLTTLVILLLAVAGVSVAQESRIFASGSNGEDPPESTAPESTSLGTTVAEDPETSASHGVSSEREIREDDSAQTVTTEPTVEATEDAGEPSANTPVVEQTRASGSNHVAEPAGNGGGIAKPEHARKGSDTARPRPKVSRPGNSMSEKRGNEAVYGRGGGQKKVTLCHKGTNTLSVGAPALHAHLRHGDILGACRWR